MKLRAPRFLIDLAVAFQFLTRLPMPEIRFEEDGLARSVKFFPVVGLTIGLGAGLLEVLLGQHLGREVSAVVIVLYLVLVTGCLHEDGLADVADSMGGWTREQRLAILDDSRIGSYGAAAIALSLLSRIVLLAALPIQHFTAYLVAAHVLSRWSALPLSYYLPPARNQEGQGARIAKLTSTFSLIFGSVLAIAIVAVALRQAAITPMLASIAVVLLTAALYMRKFGGVTGDCFGASTQLTEIAVYLCGVWTR
jgi:adenosylcobinamide-GDP ribazoletransferase